MGCTIEYAPMPAGLKRHTKAHQTVQRAAARRIPSSRLASSSCFHRGCQQRPARRDGARPGHHGGPWRRVRTLRHHQRALRARRYQQLVVLGDQSQQLHLAGVAPSQQLGRRRPRLGAQVANDRRVVHHGGRNGRWSQRCGGLHERARGRPFDGDAYESGGARVREAC